MRGNALQYVGDPDAPRPARRGLNWRGLLSLKWRKDDKESVLCYMLFMALFVADFSFLAMVFPIVLYTYALLAQTPATRFWQASPPQSTPVGLPFRCSWAMVFQQQSMLTAWWAGTQSTTYSKV